MLLNDPNDFFYWAGCGAVDLLFGVADLP